MRNGFAAMVSLYIYAGVILLTAIERLFEVRVSLKNAKWSFDRGGKEYGQGHYPFMVVLHTGFLFACVGEAWLLEREFHPLLGYPMLGVAVFCQFLRWWCITTLGPRWNTRVIIVPGLPRITNGPYRFFNHPNYIAVIIEGVALPLIHSAYFTAIGFSVLNAGLLWTRIKCEERALTEMLEKNNET